MRFQILTICFASLLMLFCAGTAFSQADVSSPLGRQQQQPEEMPKNIRESLAKMRIEQEKKDYEELLDRSEEAVKISTELEKSFAAENRLSNDDQKKLERLEKLVKKIRSELGGDDDDEQEATEKNQSPATLKNAFNTLQSSATQLFNEIKKSTRYSISVVSIQTSNTLLRLVKFIRFSK